MCPQFLRFIFRLKFWNCYDIVITFLFHLISDQWLDIRKKSLKIPKGGNKNPYIKEEQTTQRPKEKVQKDKQRSTKHTHKVKDRVTQTPLKTGVNSSVPAPLVAPIVLI